eukprot:SAG31_NODE_5267_length_2642_cov_2.352340_4_plen_100_part_00
MHASQRTCFAPRSLLLEGWSSSGSVSSSSSGSFALDRIRWEKTVALLAAAVEPAVIVRRRMRWEQCASSGGAFGKISADRGAGARQQPICWDPRGRIIL